MSEIRATTISDAAGTGPIALTGQSAAKAWVNFNGTGTAAIRDSFNVASLTDVATGQFNVSFTNSMSVGDSYSIVAAGNDGVLGIYGGTNVAGSFRTYMTNHSGSAVDHLYCMYSVDGDLA